MKRVLYSMFFSHHDGSFNDCNISDRHCSIGQWSIGHLTIHLKKMALQIFNSSKIFIKQFDKWSKDGDKKWLGRVDGVLKMFFTCSHFWNVKDLFFIFYFDPQNNPKHNDFDSVECSWQNKNADILFENIFTFGYNVGLSIFCVVFETSKKHLIALKFMCRVA